MMRMMVAFVLVVSIVALTGCAALKECRRDNLDLKAKIDQLNNANDKLTQDNKAYQDTLKVKQEALKQRMIELQQREAQAKQQNASFEQMQAAMKAEVDAKQVTIKELEGKLTVSMVEAILFDSGKATVKKAGKDALKKVADVLKTATDQDIIVAGHTDNVPITSKLAATYPTNWELSAARAIAVVKILEADGVDPKLLIAAGFSEFRPVEDNATPEGRAKNRRMEIILMPKRM
jgi:chemotaxis protein MotB